MPEQFKWFVVRKHGFPFPTEQLIAGPFDTESVAQTALTVLQGTNFDPLISYEIQPRKA